MPPIIINIPRIDRPEPPTKALAADRRLYLTRDEKSVVEEGDASAAFLLAACGSSIPGAEVDRLGLSVVEGRVVQASAEAPTAAEAPAEAPAAAETKDSQPDEDKQSAPDADKQAQPEADKQSAPAADKSDKSRREKK
jgi:hypothetical protein